jgi:hypothetical protein
VAVLVVEPEATEVVCVETDAVPVEVTLVEDVLPEAVVVVVVLPDTVLSELPEVSLVGRTGAPGVVPLDVVMAPRHRLLLMHSWPTGQQPPPRVNAHEWYPSLHVRDHVVVTVACEVTVVNCPLALAVIVTVVVYPET